MTDSKQRICLIVAKAGLKPVTSRSQRVRRFPSTPHILTSIQQFSLVITINTRLNNIIILNPQKPQIPENTALGTCW